jgi:hypothetical protein
MPKACVLVVSLMTLTLVSAIAPASRAWLPELAFSTSEQELSEDDALDRFEIDELFLPRLNVELPELFEWSEIHSAYYAQTNSPALEHARVQG